MFLIRAYVKAEHWRIDAFELWCWRRLLRVPWTSRKSNQSILKEISPGYSLEGLMLKLKLQYVGHLMRRVDSLHHVVKFWSFSFSISPSDEYSGLISFRIDWFDLLIVQGTQESSPAPQFESISSLALSLLNGPILTSMHDYWKNHSFDCMDWILTCVATSPKWPTLRKDKEVGGRFI